MGIPYDVMRMGQDFMDHMEDHPEQSEDLIEHMKEAFEQFRLNGRYKSIEGTYSSNTTGRENIMETITLKDQNGTGVVYGKKALLEMLAAEGINVSENDFPRVPGEARFSTPPQQPLYGQQQHVRYVDREVVKEEPLLTKAEVRQAERQAELASLIDLNWKRKGTQVLWKMVEIAGVAMVIGGVILLGVWIAQKIWTPADGPMPALS